MELVYEYTLKTTSDPQSQLVGAGPFGTRVVASQTGTIKGKRVNGRMVGPNADWVLIGADGYMRLDGRGQVLTDDGAVLYASYTGLLESSEKMQAATASGGETQFDDQYYRLSLRLETGDKRYAWVNTTMFVGRGRRVPGGGEYEIYRVT